jgi:hypothetical protein
VCIGLVVTEDGFPLGGSNDASIHLPLVGKLRYNALQILGDIGGLITASETSHD